MNLEPEPKAEEVLPHKLGKREIGSADEAESIEDIDDADNPYKEVDLYNFQPMPLSTPKKELKSDRNYKFTQNVLERGSIKLSQTNDCLEMTHGAAIENELERLEKKSKPRKGGSPTQSEIFEDELGDIFPSGKKTSQKSTPTIDNSFSQPTKKWTGKIKINFV